MFVGTLPPDFLRITAASQQQQEAADQQAALALQQQVVGVPYAHSAAGRLSITVAQVQWHNFLFNICTTVHPVLLIFLRRDP